jgi:DNA-binding transcriptional LysR family regulator
VDFSELQVFLTVATERSFSRAAARLHRTQPAVSQAVKRLEDELGERLFDRSSKGGLLTEAGSLLLDYARRLTRLKEEAQEAVRELQDLRRGRVLIGANEAAVHVLLPVIERFRKDHPQAQVEVSRVAARGIAGEVLNRSLDFGVLTFPPRDHGIRSLPLGEDDMVMLTHPSHPLAKRRQITMEEFGRQTVIAHNDPSPTRERVLRLYEKRHAPINIQIGLPSLDGIKRAIEMGLGVALLPRRCALSEIEHGQLAAIKVPQLGLPRDVRLIYRASGEMTHAAEAFLEAAQRSDTTKKATARRSRTRTPSHTEAPRR